MAAAGAVPPAFEMSEATSIRRRARVAVVPARQLARAQSDSIALLPMPITADQSAVLEMLLAGQSFADLDDLLGLSEDDVREPCPRGADRARRRRPGPQRRPERLPARPGGPDRARGRRPAPAPGRRRPRARRRGSPSELAELAPAARAPEAPARPGGRRFLEPRRAGAPAEPAARAPSAVRRWPALPQGRRRASMPALGAAAVILIAVVLGVDRRLLRRRRARDAAATTTASADGEPTPIAHRAVQRESRRRGAHAASPLKPPGNGDAARRRDRRALDRRPALPRPRGREPRRRRRRDEAYVVWFMFDEKTRLPAVADLPRERLVQGPLRDPAAVAGLISQRRAAIEISLSDAAGDAGRDPAGRPGRDLPDRAPRTDRPRAARSRDSARRRRTSAPARAGGD